MWICPVASCGNENWPLRTFCNKCKAPKPGPWDCPTCGNHNFEKRTFCNKKSCGRPRPGAPSGLMSQMGMMMPMNPMMMQQPMMGQNPPGSWICRGCKNVNWPLRTSCKKCEMSREEGDPQYLTHCAATGENPPGSWVCIGCQNVNWPKRTTCKKCEAPRETHDGGAPETNSPPAGKGKGKGNMTKSDMPQNFVHNVVGNHPPGSWTCSACQNVNWPLRTSCKMCNMEKDVSVDSGGGKGGGKSNPEGSWTCEVCGNCNWPMRTVCNKKDCQAPRPW